MIIKPAALPQQKMNLGFVESLFTSRPTPFEQVYDTMRTEFSTTLLKKLSATGIEINTTPCSLFNMDTSDECIYEVFTNDLLSLPPRLLKQLDRYNLLISDTTEGGYRFNKLEILPEKSKLLSSGFNTDQHHLPIFMLHVYSLTKHDSTLYNYSAPNYKKLAIIPNRNPRQHRIAAIQCLHDYGYLDRCDWSTIIHTGKTVPLDFWHGPNLNPDNLSQYSVIRDNIFPRAIPGTRLGKIHMNAVEPAWYGKYKWHIALETYQDHIFPTEKTFKSFITGSGSLPVGCKGIQTKLEEFGFRFQFKYDHLDYHNQVKFICENVLDKHEPDQDIIKHNHDLLFNREFLVDSFVKCMQDTVK